MTGDPVPDRRARVADAVLGVAMAGFAAAAFVGAAELPPSPFDPLGPGRFPLVLAGLLGLLSLILLARVALGLAVGRSATAMIHGLDGEGRHRRRPWLAVGLFLATVAYAVALGAGAGFLAPTVVFLFVVGAALSGRSRREIGIAFAVAAAGGTATWALFSRVFLVQWP